MPPLNKENWKVESIIDRVLHPIVEEAWYIESARKALIKEIEKLLVYQESQVRKSCAEMVRDRKIDIDELDGDSDDRMTAEATELNEDLEDIARSIEQGNK